MARRLITFWRSTYALIALIVVAATALSYFSYEYAHEMAQRGEESIVSSTRIAAQERAARIDSVIRDSDALMFAFVDVGNLKELPRRWSDFGRSTPTIESVIVLGEELRIAPDGFVSKKHTKGEVEAFRFLFEHHILNDLGLPALADREERRLHREYGGRPYLLSYTRRDVGGHRSYIVLEEDLWHLVADIFPQEFQADEGHYLYQIVDERESLVFGLPFTGVPPKYLISVVPQTLQAWRLRMAPRDVPRLVAKESSRRATDWIFIGLSSVTLFVGIGVLTYAMRTERRANQLKSDFIANVSHELKTPLSLIRMFGELLASGRTKSEDDARQYAEIITRESERLSRLIDNVLDFARIERGAVALDFKVGDLAEVLSRGLDVYRHRLEREGMKLTVEIEDGLPPVRMDENAMTLVLLNLVDNAVKYAADGQSLHVSLRRAGDRVLLAVQDRGPGIESDETDRIFERFYRARRVRGRPVRGSGIGLSLVKNIAAAHGGDVTVASTPGEGSTFTVSLPAVAVPATAPVPSVATS